MTHTPAEPNADNGPLGQLANSEERMRLMVEAVKDYAIFMLDTGGHIASWNSGAERLTGYRADEIIGQHFSIFYTEEDRLRCHPAMELRRAVSEGRYEEEGMRVRKDGSRFWANVLITAVFSRDGRHIGFAKVTRDVTERRLAEAELRRSEERFRLLVNGVQDYGIFMLDAQGCIASWNAGAERIKGYSASEVLGRHFSLFYSDEDRERGHPEYELGESVRHGSYSEEGWRFRKDGTRFWASVHITTLRDESGHLVGFAKVTRDLTERRRAEEALRQANEELERRVQERTTALSAANKELEASSYSVSHDLRAPLRAIDGFSRLLETNAGDRLNEQERDYLGRIRAAAKRMSELTDAMMMLSRLTRTPVQRQSVDLSSLASEIADELRLAEPERNVTVSIEPGLLAVADRRLIRTALENLLRNAWKYTRNASQPRIEVGQRQENGERVYFVKDNGVGFDPALKYKLFLPFQRLHRAALFEGFGIGLATVHRIIERHGGHVWADAAPSEGATFSFTLGGPDEL